MRFLPPEIQSEVKSLLKLSKTAAGTDIYKRLKTELIELFGPKPEDAYVRAKNRVLTGKPSQLGKAIMDDLTDGDISCNNCAKTVWGMFRESLPIVVRNHVAEMSFTKDTYKEVFRKADQVWDSNRGSEPLPAQAVAAASTATHPEVAAVQRNQKNKNQRPNQNQNQNQNQGKNPRQNNQTQGNQNNKNPGQSETKPKKPVNEDNLCKIHAKWKENATFCVAPWACCMKNIYKAPQ